MIDLTDCWLFCAVMGEEAGVVREHEAGTPADWSQTARHCSLLRFLRHCRLMNRGFTHITQDHPHYGLLGNHY